jgi:hypothetical protein
MFMLSFYAGRSHKYKKRESSHQCLFALLGSAGINIGEIDPWVNYTLYDVPFCLLKMKIKTVGKEHKSKKLMSSQIFWFQIKIPHSSLSMREHFFLISFPSLLLASTQGCHSKNTWHSKGWGVKQKVTWTLIFFFFESKKSCMKKKDYALKDALYFQSIRFTI